MFTVAIDREQGVLLARFSGPFGRDDLAAFDSVVDRVVAVEGPLCGLFDYSEVTMVTMSVDAMARRGRQPQMFPGRKRVIVAPRPEMFGLGRVFGAYQASVGSEPPMVVRTMGEAIDYLGFGPLCFEPVDIAALPTKPLP